jgi:hypothetical protein
MAKGGNNGILIVLLVIAAVFIFAHCLTKPVEGFKNKKKQVKEHYATSVEEEACLKKYLPPDHFNTIVKAHKSGDTNTILNLMQAHKNVAWYGSRCRFTDKDDGTLDAKYIMPGTSGTVAPALDPQEKTLLSAEKQKMMTQSALLEENFKNPYASYPPGHAGHEVQYADPHATFDANDPYDQKKASLHEGFLEPFCGRQPGRFRLYDKYGCCEKRYGQSGWNGYSQCVLTGEGMQPC